MCSLPIRASKTSDKALDIKYVLDGKGKTRKWEGSGRGGGLWGREELQQFDEGTDVFASFLETGAGVEEGSGEAEAEEHPDAAGKGHNG